MERDLFWLTAVQTKADFISSVQLTSTPLAAFMVIISYTLDFPKAVKPQQGLA